MNMYHSNNQKSHIWQLVLGSQPSYGQPRMQLNREPQVLMCICRQIVLGIQAVSCNCLRRLLRSRCQKHLMSKRLGLPLSLSLVLLPLSLLLLALSRSLLSPSLSVGVASLFLAISAYLTVVVASIAVVGPSLAGVITILFCCH